MSEKETYTVTAECTNCAHIPKEKTPNGTVIGPREYQIRWGVAATIFFMSETCPNCGCRGTLHRR